MSRGIKHIFFDLDHTLWDFDRNSGLTFEKIFEDLNIKISLIDFLSVYEPINLKYWKLYREEQISKPDLRYHRLREAFDLIEYYPDDDIVNQVSTAYIDHLSGFNHLLDGTIEVLQYLQNSYQLHIITNGFEEVQRRKLRNAKIDGFFHSVTNSDMVGVKKPNPKIFNFAMHSVSANPDESLMIGDSLEADIQGAESVGMRTIWFDPKASSNGYTKQRVHNLIELKNLL